MDTTNLENIYASIQGCHVCKLMDKEKALRRIDAIDLRTDVMMISQSLAEGQLRKTGINFFGLDGKAGKSGLILERLLNKFNRTIYPSHKIQISQNIEIPACQDGMIPIYNTEIVQCFPGKATKAKGDREPKVEEVIACHSRGFLMAELEIIKPKLVILHGEVSRKNFYKYYLDIECPLNMTSHIFEIIRSQNLPSIRIGTLETQILPMMHAASRGKPIWDFINNETVISLVKNSLT